jgi:tetratricopeptide (TPR) repeat protein
MTKIASITLLTVLLGCSSKPETHPPDSAQNENLYQQAQQALKARRLVEAAQTLEILFDSDTLHYEAAHSLGEIYLRQKRYQQALRPLERAQRLQPARIEARMQLAQALARLGREAEARALFTRLVDAFPGNVTACMAYADLLMTQDQPDAAGALAQYDAILAIDPRHYRARSGKAASLLRLGNFAAAAVRLDTLLAERPNDVYLAFLLGSAHHHLRQYEQAVDAYKRAIDVLPPASPQRTVRQWNLRLAYMEAYNTYPGDLEPAYQIGFAALDEESPVHFTDVAEEAGVGKKDRGRGVAWLDYDRDGDPDIFAAGIQTPHGFYRNDGDGHFTDITAKAGLADPRGGWASIAADYDADGDPDIFVTREAWEGTAPNSLYQNQGNGTFKDRGAQAGVDGDDDSFMAVWTDYDNDGLPDLYVASGITGSKRPNRLYQNQGDGTFKDRGAQAGVDYRCKTLGVTCGDYDDDGDSDLYAIDVYAPNHLYRNDGQGAFSDVTAQAGVAKPTEGSYVGFFIDAEGDGDLDLFISAMNFYEDVVQSRVTGLALRPTRAYLYRNDGQGAFSDIAPQQGLARSFGSMGAGFGDIDYDGLVDIYLTNGGPIMSRFEPNILFHNRGDRFADITVSAGVGNPGKGHGVGFADYDQDGDLDLYTAVGGHYPGDLWANSLYRNEGHINHWLGIDLGAAAIGARLRLRAQDLLSVVEVNSGPGFGSTNSLSAEIGLGARSRIDTLEIRWPDGAIEYHTDLEIDQFHHFAEQQ